MVVIAYAVSIVFTLCIAVGILPYLHYKFYLKDNIPYAVISFVLTALMSAYHLSIMFRTRKRRTDQESGTQTEQPHWFKNRSLFTRVFFIVIVLYTPCAIASLLLIFRVIPYIPWAKIPYASIGFAITSFLLASAISAYHLGIMLRRRKRKTDSVAAAQAAA
jgi:membrane protein implicated in regulation of membrane protease activity